MADIATLQARIAEVEAALHDLAMGKRVVAVWRDGRRVEYQQANSAALSSYLADLREELRQAQVDAGLAPRSPRRPIGLLYT